MLRSSRFSVLNDEAVASSGPSGSLFDLSRTAVQVDAASFSNKFRHRSVESPISLTGSEIEDISPSEFGTAKLVHHPFPLESCFQSVRGGAG